MQLRKYIFWLLVSVLFSGYAQIGRDGKIPGRRSSTPKNIGKVPITNDTLRKETDKKEFKTYPLKEYKFFLAEKPADTIPVDTLMGPENIYKANFVQRDIFGFMPFQNIGQPVNFLIFENLNPGVFYNLIRDSKLPFYKHWKKLTFYHVPTPYSRLFYLSGNKQGQMLDSKIGVNVKPNFYIGTGYAGLSSLGYYQNSVSEMENWFVQSEYFHPDKKYLIRFALIKNHLENEENGGIVDETFFEQPGNDYLDRGKIPVKLSDKSIWHSRQTYLYLRMSPWKNKENYGFYRFEYLKSYYQYEGGNASVYGNTVPYSIPIDSTGYRNYKHQTGLAFSGKNWTEEISLDFHKLLIRFDTLVPVSNIFIDQNNQENFLFLNSKTSYGTKNITQILNIKYELNFKQLYGEYSLIWNLKKSQLKFHLKHTSRLPDPVFRLHQSRFERFNWKNTFEKTITTNPEVSYQNAFSTTKAGLVYYQNPVYFGPDSLPQQYNGNFSLFYLRVRGKVKWKKFSFSPTVLFQKISDNNPALDLPEFQWRLLVYYEDFWFKKNMHLLTGIRLKFFTPYYMAGFNPLTGMFFQQRNRLYGGFYLADYFFDFKVKKFRAYLHLNHFNALWERFSPRYYSAPFYPYADTFIRLGIEWEFIN